ncbi:MAG: leucine-rich repeat protein [Clostridia bacterium]|nr:leucine-rich repeat protein [Clostridia bacterium]
MGQTEKDPGQAETVSNKRKKTGGKIAMKKIRRFLLVLLMIAAVCFCVSAVAETSGKCGDNVTWTLSDDGVLRISGTGRMSDDFEGGGESEAIKTVIIEDGVTSIGKYAFRGCSSLTSITIPESVTYIGNQAFFRCSSLTSITIPDGVTEIGEHAFDGCSSLTSITIPDGVTVIRESTFNACSSLTSITIPESVTYIRKYAFSGCSSLTSITIPDSVTSIGTYAFSGCSSLTSITIPDSVTSIAGNVFYKCSSLRNITLSDNMTSIGEYAFAKCKNLTSILIPGSVEGIGQYAFGDCSSLTCVTIPDGVTYIGDYAFQNCSSLNAILIPDSLTSIGKNAFKNCDNLSSIRIPSGIKNIGDYPFENCSNLKSITIADGVTEISNTTIFDRSNTNLKIYLPQSVTSIGKPNMFGVYIYPPTVYCYELSYAEQWARRCFCNVVLLDDPNASVGVQVELPEKLDMLVGNKQQIYPYIFPETSSPMISWKSSQPEILTVDDAGFFTAGKEGDAVVTVTVDGISASTVVHVGPQIDKILLPEEILVAAKSQESFEVNYLPQNAVVNFSFKIEDKELATVNESGMIIGGYGVGETSITVTDEISGKSETTKLVICYPVTAIELSPNNTTMKAGESLQINAHVTMKTQTCENQLVTYSSNDENVATVDKKGLVTAKEAGNVTIKATAASGVSASSQITVISILPGDVNEDGIVDGKDVTAIELSPAKTTMKPGKSLKINAKVTMGTQTYENQMVAYSSSDESIATVDTNGTVTAKAAGDVIIKATADSGVSASSQITVSIDYSPDDVNKDGVVDGKDVTAIELSPNKASMKPGKSLKINAKVTMGTQTYENQMVAYSSSDESIATVDTNGTVTAKAAGDVTIKATADSGVSASSQISVTSDPIPGDVNEDGIVDGKDVTAIKLAPDKTTLKSGKTLKLNAYVTTGTQTCENQLVIYSSSDDSIATVDMFGTVTGKSAGIVTIKATADSGVSASSQITVIKECLPGDVNDDGVVDGRDVLRLMKYLADEKDPETGKLIEINEDNADVDGSGTVDEKDLLRLIRYLGGENVELLPGAVSGNG